ncbi:hypothetical protein [Saccharopolyspora sp. NPDC002376]
MKFRRQAIALVTTGLSLVALPIAGCSQQPAPPDAQQINSIVEIPV